VFHESGWGKQKLMYFEQNCFGCMLNVRTVTCRRGQVPRGSSNTSEKMVANEGKVCVALVEGHCP